jgi:outer membrane lipoprotein
MRSPLKKLLPAFFLVTFVISCAPVLRPEYMKEGIRNPNLPALLTNAASFKGKLFIFGGVIVNTRITSEGSLIEAIYVPVNKRGVPQEVQAISARFLALFPKDSGLLEPSVYKKNREVTIAGIYEGVRTGKINKAEYTFPFFVIRQIYLWREEELYPAYSPYGPYGVYPYYTPYYSPFNYPYTYAPNWYAPGMNYH